MTEHSFWCCGYPCKVSWHETGHFCGYVGLSTHHPFYGLSVEKIENREDAPSVHGGVTYAEALNPETKSKDGLWWLGFDCAHAGDWIPWMEEAGFDPADYHVWTVEEVMEETAQLALQLREGDR